MAQKTNNTFDSLAVGTPENEARTALGAIRALEEEIARLKSELDNTNESHRNLVHHLFDTESALAQCPIGIFNDTFYSDYGMVKFDDGKFRVAELGTDYINAIDMDFSSLVSGTLTTGYMPYAINAHELDDTGLYYDIANGRYGFGFNSGLLATVCINGGLHVGGVSAVADNNLLVDGNSRSATLTVATDYAGFNVDFRTISIGFGSTQSELYIQNNVINSGYTQNANYELKLNYSGYSAGASQFRDLGIYDGKNAAIALFDGSANALLIDHISERTSGHFTVFGTNAGVQTTGQAWGGGICAFQVGGFLSMYGTTGVAAGGAPGMASNAYYSATGWKRVINDESSAFSMSNGNFYWYSSPAGAADAAITFSEMMHLTSSGNLNIIDITTTNTAPHFTLDNITSTHGMTSGGLPASAYFGIYQAGWGTNAGAGGAIIRAIEYSNTVNPMQIDGLFYSTNPTNSLSAILLRGGKSDGSTGIAALDAAETVLQVNNYTTPLFTMLGDGTPSFVKLATVNTGIIWASATTGTLGATNIPAGTFPIGSASAGLAGSLLSQAGEVITMSHGAGTNVQFMATSDVSTATSSITSYNGLNSELSMYTYGSGVVGTVCGLNYASLAQLYANSSIAMLIHNVHATAPIVFGTNNIERARINASGLSVIGLATADTGIVYAAATTGLLAAQNIAAGTIPMGSATTGLAATGVSGNAYGLYIGANAATANIPVYITGAAAMNWSVNAKNTTNTGYTEFCTINDLGNITTMQVYGSTNADTLETLTLDNRGMLYTNATEGLVICSDTAGAVQQPIIFATRETAGANTMNTVYFRGGTLNGEYESDTDTAALYINYYGYRDGITRYRDTYICDGKGANLVIVDGSAGYVGIGGTPLSRLWIKQSADDYMGGIHLQESGTLDTWSIYQSTAEAILIGYATHASGADAAGDFTTLFTAYKDGQLDMVGMLTVDHINCHTGGHGVVCDTMFKQPGAFAGIHCHDASAAQTIATGATYTKLTCFTADGQSSNVTPDYANDKITITIAGRYFVGFTVSGTAGTVNLTWRFAAFLNGAEQDHIHAKGKVATTGDSQCFSGLGFIDVTTVPWDLDLRARHSGVADADFTVEYANLTCLYVGET